MELEEIKHNSNKGALSRHVVSENPPWGCQDKQSEIQLVNTWEGVSAGQFQGCMGVNGSFKKRITRKWPLSHTHPMGSYLRNVCGNSVLQCLNQHWVNDLHWSRQQWAWLHFSVFIWAHPLRINHILGYLLLAAMSIDNVN